MFEKDMRLTLLLDHYGDLLSEHRREIIEMYYCEDLSLAEIAENTGITRQGVRDSIKRAECILLDLEAKIGWAGRYRELGVPFDGIIQDWQYWGSNYTWNAMEFLNEEFGNAQRMIDEVHEKNAHISISIWSSFGPHTKPYKELKEKGHLMSFYTWPESGLGFWPPRMDYPSGVRVYDAYNPEARDL